MGSMETTTMKVIYKYLLDLTYKQTLYLPPGFIVRHVANQAGAVTMWIEIDNSRKPTTPVDFYVNGTAHEVIKGLTYCGTALVGDFVWHVYMHVGIDPTAPYGDRVKGI